LLAFDGRATPFVQKPPFASEWRLHVGVQHRVVLVQVYVLWKPFPCTATVSM
jgi:hypothetical protein